jgi:hypothetical protein
MQKIILYTILLITQLIFSQKEYDVIIKNANVITLEKNIVLPNQTIAISNGKIVEMESTNKSKLKGKKVIDLKGRYIMPSLADAHVHFPNTEVEMERMMQLFLLNGVTKLRSMRGDWKHTEWREKYNSTASLYPRLYLSAPPISRNYDLTFEQIEEFVKKAKDNNFDFVKILSIRSQPIFQQLDSICKKHNMPIGGHFPRLASGNYLTEDVFFNSNYASIEHLGGLAGETEMLESRLQKIKEKNMYLCPTINWYNVGSGRFSFEELRNQPGMEYVAKKTVDEWIEGTKKYIEKMGEVALKKEIADEIVSIEEKFKLLKRLNDEGFNLLLSPDASSNYMIPGFSMSEEMKLYKQAGLSNFDILKTATVNFNNFFKGNYGTIAIDKDADFIVLEHNPLENLETLKNIKGLYFNENYLELKQLQDMANKLKPTN